MLTRLRRAADNFARVSTENTCNFLAAAILERASGVCVRPVQLPGFPRIAADMLARCSSEKVFPLFPALILALVSTDTTRPGLIAGQLLILACSACVIG